MIENFTPTVNVTAVNYFKRFLLDEDYSFSGHTHNNTWELNVFLKGENEITGDKSVFLAKETDALIISPGTFHACGGGKKEKCDKLVVEFMAEGFELRENLSFYQFSMDSENMALVNLLMDEAFKYSDMNPRGTEGTLSGTGKKLLEVFLHRLMRMESEPRYSLDNDSLIYHRAVKFMEQNIDKNPSVEDVARAAGVCVTLIKRAFSKFTGKGVNAYFIDMKVNVAKDMLKNGKSCFEVSKALGFSSQAYFSRCFKKNAGVLPSKYEVRK